MSALSNADRIRLARLHEIAKADPTNPTEGGRALADSLRGALIDLDDVTVGRVALELGKYIGQLADLQDDHAMHVLTNQVMCAALDLTAAEWQEIPS